jgi:hypothetical protein
MALPASVSRRRGQQQLFLNQKNSILVSMYNQTSKNAAQRRLAKDAELFCLHPTQRVTQLIRRYALTGVHYAALNWYVTNNTQALLSIAEQEEAPTTWLTAHLQCCCSIVPGRPAVA